MRVRIATLLAFMLWITSCGGSHEGSPVLRSAELPPFPSEPAGLEVIPRAASVDKDVTVPGAQFFAKAESCIPGDPGMLLAAGPGELAWAVYRVADIAADYRPTAVETQVAEPGGEYFVAFANYDRRRWELMPGTYSGYATHDVANWSQYRSPSSSFYFAVLVWGPTLTLRQSVVTIVDSRQLPAPTGLSATALSGSALLAWDLYPDERADMLRVYRATEPTMAGAVPAKDIWDPTETSTTVGNLANDETYYFTLTATWSSESIESPHSNIASATPSELPPPSGLAALGRSKAVDLSWAPYPDSRADLLRVYQSLDPGMADAAAVLDIPDPTETSASIEGLTNGQRYYFALTALWTAQSAESRYSNIASATPHEPGSGGTLAGLWPRRGNREDNRGCTTNTGPPSFDDYVSVNIARGRETVANRTSPVIDNDGNVYALTGDAVLVKYPRDLAANVWEFAAADHGTPGATYVAPPHSPCLDSEGNAYFIAAPDSSSPGSGTPYLFCVSSSGDFAWRFDMGTVSDDLTTPYPAPNITGDGIVVALLKEKHVLAGIEFGGTSPWAYSFEEAREVHADPAISTRGTLEMPVWFSGFGIDPSEQWISLSATDGNYIIDYKEMGRPRNIFSGLPVMNDYFVYPELDYLILLDAVRGLKVDTLELNDELTSSPARSNDGRYVFQLRPGYEGPPGPTRPGALICGRFGSNEPPDITEVFALMLNNIYVSSQPAVDGDNTLFFPIDEGWVYRVEFDPGAPIGDGNPLISDYQRIGRSDTYHFNCFAIGDGAAYIVTEQNMLYGIGIRE